MRPPITAEPKLPDSGYLNSLVYDDREGGDEYSSNEERGRETLHIINNFTAKTLQTLTK